MQTLMPDKSLKSEFEMWVCTRHSSCGSASGAVCFTYREGLEVFVPWGLESELNFLQVRR